MFIAKSGWSPLNTWFGFRGKGGRGVGGIIEYTYLRLIMKYMKVDYKIYEIL